MTFLLNTCLPVVGLDVKCWPEDASVLLQAKLSDPDVVRGLCGQDGNAKKKFAWLRVFCEHVVPCKPSMKLEWLLGTNCANEIPMFDDGSDHHRISVDHLHLIKNEAVKDLKTDLMYMLFITTGMRIGGLCRIKIEHIATVMSKDVDVNETGRTLEKGNKWFTFIMSPEVRHLMSLWITKKRPASPSPYLFPGCGSSGHQTTASVRWLFAKVFEKAGLSGKEFHPHALRHSYAHILLESGNSVDKVSKLLNHSSVAVTEKYYLKESAAQVAERANIPWLNNSKAKRAREVLPEFLSDNAPSMDRAENKLTRKKRRTKIMENLSRIS
jgi:predicted transcriptional regulator